MDNARSLCPRDGSGSVRRAGREMGKFARLKAGVERGVAFFKDDDEID